MGLRLSRRCAAVLASGLVVLVDKRAAYPRGLPIEERELHFTPEAPLLAWRLFRVRAGAGGAVLGSPMIHDPDPPPWEHASYTAVCIEEGHPAPAAGCRCGVYAAIEGTLDSLPGYLGDNAHDEDPWAYAEVACTGRVFVDMRGVRAERAEVVRIALAEHSWPTEKAFADVRQALSERYGVPVGGLADAPDWLTGNLRTERHSRADGREGPPPDDATLDLGSLNLGQ